MGHNSCILLSTEVFVMFLVKFHYKGNIAESMSKSTINISNKY